MIRLKITIKVYADCLPLLTRLFCSNMSLSIVLMKDIKKDNLLFFL